jgi:hypothetical protein
MRRGRAFINSFDAVPLTRADLRDYDGFRAKVLEAGRFSVFEATATQPIARLYDRLCRDPLVITDNQSLGFPWTAVRPTAALFARPSLGGQHDR